MTIQHRPEIKDLQPYRPGKPIADVKREYGLTHVVKLASNENPLGYSDQVGEAIRQALDHLSLYPDGNCTDLKNALAAKFGLHPSQILPSGGSDEMVDMISKAYVNPGDEVIIADVTFPRYISTAKMMGGTPVVVPLKEFTYDLESMYEAITDKTKLIWLCNPNNPTGTMFGEKALLEFLDKVPAHIMVIYDEAYNEYVTREDYPKEAYKLINDYPNVLVMRTFSKIYGLAALRIGYTMANEEIITALNKIRNPFNVSSIAQMAAIAALSDQDFVAKAYRLNQEGKEYIYHAFDEMGITYASSEANHIFFNCQYDTQKIFSEMQKRGVIIRPMFDTYARVSIGTMEENQLFVHTLKEVFTILEAKKESACGCDCCTCK
ncbi:histidinol-phosphate transaminase [Anaerosolibacter sp.]|jgi:histidinol-phosphate aminotransferase|uniref:histidinol-phosphate transaminase n=1 Tax=Anaerosolibacter sp. TaxID=1872527 RepID=UPI002610A5AF|nr:histidinol-phosphate transaminase [Anaerosolibacter sp.]